MCKASVYTDDCHAPNVMHRTVHRYLYARYNQWYYLVQLHMSIKAGYRILIAFSIALALAFLVLDQVELGGRRLAKIKGEDTVNYFGTTHSILFDHDFNLNNELERMPPTGRMWTERRKETGLPGNPWGLGFSFLELPLLALGTGIDALVGNPADGYSKWAILIYCVGPVLMSGCALLALYNLLCQVGAYWKIPEDRQALYALFATFVMFFGTNVGYYAFSEMAHASTFLLACLFLATWWRVRFSDVSRDWLVLGLIGGFFSICRWQDLIYTGGPLLFDLFGGDVLRKGRAWWRSRLFYMAGVGAWWIPQVIQWKIIYGKYLTIPQGGDIFSFPPTHIWQVLFSTQAGWFIWTPVTILGTIGVLLGAGKSLRTFLPWIIVFCLQVMLVGSISFWHGVESFGARYLLSNNVLVGIGMMTLLAMSGVMARRALVAACAACCIFTSLFAIQFRLDLIPKGTQLTFNELITDKFHLLRARQRKAAVAQARSFMANGDYVLAVRLLEDTQNLGEDRDVYQVLSQAYQAMGNQDLAESVRLKRKAYLESGL